MKESTQINTKTKGKRYESSSFLYPKTTLKRARVGAALEIEGLSRTQGGQEGGVASRHPSQEHHHLQNYVEGQSTPIGSISVDDEEATMKKRKKGKKKRRKTNVEGLQPQDEGGHEPTTAVLEHGSLAGSPKAAGSPEEREIVVNEKYGVPSVEQDPEGAMSSGKGAPSSAPDKSISKPDRCTNSNGGDVMDSSPTKERRRSGKSHGKAYRTHEAATVSGNSGNSGMSPSRPLIPPGLPGQRNPRKHTLSVAIPGSVVDNAQSRELKTYLVGEIARAAAIFEVDEIVVYDDLSVSRKGQGGVLDDGPSTSNGSSSSISSGNDRNNPNVFMARLLQYAETPQYLRKKLFPMHPSLRLAGLLNPLDSPHHMREDDDCPFREGVVVDRDVKKGAGSFVDIGKRKEARIDRALTGGVRVTVKLDKRDPCKKNHKGRAVAPSVPREELGLYWGYQTRLASGLADVLAGCPFKGGYDLTVGTSERGTVTVDDADFALPTYRHALIVFGGVQGIEATVDADESLQLPGSDSSALFDMWVNTCPGQGSRTIRTEEAVLITLARLRAHVLRNQA